MVVGKGLNLDAGKVYVVVCGVLSFRISEHTGLLPLVCVQTAFTCVSILRRDWGGVQIYHNCQPSHT